MQQEKSEIAYHVNIKTQWHNKMATVGASSCHDLINMHEHP